MNHQSACRILMLCLQQFKRCLLLKIAKKNSKHYSMCVKSKNLNRLNDFCQSFRETTCVQTIMCCSRFFLHKFRRIIRPQLLFIYRGLGTLVRHDCERMLNVGCFSFVRFRVGLAVLNFYSMLGRFEGLYLLSLFEFTSGWETVVRSVEKVLCTPCLLLRRECE